jgi:hypothetical protein
MASFARAGKFSTSHVASFRFGLWLVITLAVEGRCLRDIPYFLPAMQYSDAKKETHFAAGALGTWAEHGASEFLASA